MHWQTEQTLIRLLLQEQSDQDLYCLLWIFVLVFCIRMVFGGRAKTNMLGISCPTSPYEKNNSIIILNIRTELLEQTVKTMIREEQSVGAASPKSTLFAIFSNFYGISFMDSKTDSFTFRTIMVIFHGVSMFSMITTLLPMKELIIHW